MKKILKSTFIFNQLKEAITSGKFVSGFKLPSIPQLTKSFGVSKKTIQDAMDELEKQDLIIRSKGSGIYVKNKREEESTDPRKDKSFSLPKTKIQEIADQIIHDISLGRLKLGTRLPLKKFLQYEYGTSKNTIRSVIENIKERGMIYRKGTSFIIGNKSAPVTTYRKNCIYIVANVEKIKAERDSRLRNEFYSEFEKEVNKYGANVTFIDLEEPSLSLINAITKSDTIGFLYLYNYQRLLNKNYEPEKMLKMELEQLAKTNFPVVIYNHYEIHNQFPSFSFNFGRNAYVLGVMDDKKAGEELGIYLASLGHKSIAFFSIFNESWCKQRFKGIELGLKKVYGDQAKAMSFSAKLDTNLESVPTSLGKFTKVLGYFSKSEIKTLQQAIIKLRKGHDLKSYHLSFDPFTLLMDDAYQTIKNVIRYEKLLPCFEEAFKEKNFTAWVGADMYHAIAIMDFLKKNQVQIPQNMSVAGIDDRNKGSFLDITAHDFQAPLMGYLAARCLFGDIPIYKDRNGIVECPGTVIIRGSTRKIESPG